MWESASMTRSFDFCGAWRSGAVAMSSRAISISSRLIIHPKTRFTIMNNLSLYGNKCIPIPTPGQGACAAREAA